MEFSEKTTAETEYLTKLTARRKNFGKEKLLVYLNLNHFDFRGPELRGPELRGQKWIFYINDIGISSQILGAQDKI